jgi:hypothetical protein
MRLLTIFDAFMKDRRDIPARSSTRGLAIDVLSFETMKILFYQSPGSAGALDGWRGHGPIRGAASAATRRASSR